MLPVGVLLEYLQKMIFFIKRSEISSSDVFLTIRMQVAVSATTDFKCDIISIRQQSGKFFLPWLFLIALVAVMGGIYLIFVAYAKVELKKAEILPAIREE